MLRYQVSFGPVYPMSHDYQRNVNRGVVVLHAKTTVPRRNIQGIKSLDTRCSDSDN
jgi:hypothetical protein